MTNDENLEECPGCDRPIGIVSTCPHCKYNLIKGEPGQEKEEKPKKKKKLKRIIPQSNSKILVPALGRYNKPDIDFPELHWKKGNSVNDKTLTDWVKTLREVWSEIVEECPGYLTNRAILYLIDEIQDPTLIKNRAKVKKILGDDGT